MSRCCGVTCRGTGSRPTANSRNRRLGACSLIDGDAAGMQDENDWSNPMPALRRAVDLAFRFSPLGSTCITQDRK